MIAHVAFPALEPDPTRIATTSRQVVSGLLREQLGFKGVIVSDAMEMKGLTKLFPEGGSNAAGRAAVDTVKAGQDMLELPSDLDGTFNGLLQAVKSGEISRAQIDASVRRLLLVKARAGLDARGQHLVDLNKIQYSVGKLSSYALAQEVADHAVTLVRDDNHMLPLQRGELKPVLVVLFVSDAHGDDGRVFEREIRTRIQGATVIYVDRRLAAVEAEGIAALASKATACHRCNLQRVATRAGRDRRHQRERPFGAGLRRYSQKYSGYCRRQDGCARARQSLLHPQLSIHPQLSLHLQLGDYV